MRYVLFGVLLFFAACSSVEENISEVEIDISDPEIQKIFSFQDEQKKDSLLNYLAHPNPVYRYLSSLAFGSIKDTSYQNFLLPLLQDPTDIVRTSTAFSIGQMNGINAESHLLDAFNRYDTSGFYKKTNRAILEAVGKVGSLEQLKNLSNVTTYEPTDTFLLEGQAWGIYRYGGRGITVFEGTTRMVNLATNFDYPSTVRLIAANYLARYSLNLDTFNVALSQTFSRNNDPNIRMAMAIALGKCNRQVALDTLLSNLPKERDYRVRCNMIRALGNFDYAKVQPTILESLQDKNLHVAKRAAQFFVENGIPEDATFYRRKAKEMTLWPIEISLYAAANRHLPAYYADYRGLINYDLRRKFQQATSAYEKVAVLDAMAEYLWNYRMIQQFGKSDSSIIVQSGAVQALAKISKNKAFNKVFGRGVTLAERELVDFFLEAIESGDVGKIALAASALRDPNHDYKSYIDSLALLDDALVQLNLPEKVEAYNELNATIDYFNGINNSSPVKLKFNHPIRWDLLEQINSKTTAAILTSKGTISIRLLPHVAPGSVANFIELARRNFFNGKNFHRVVPNFVIQGGCTRGDGYGALDYSIRSELSPLHYTEPGFVGMASAGNHTEGTQFFITHSPTPHLDGNYTVFAKVATAESMQVVDRIQPGDEIKSVTIRN